MPATPPKQSTISPQRFMISLILSGITLLLLGAVGNALIQSSRLFSPTATPTIVPKPTFTNTPQPTASTTNTPTPLPTATSAPTSTPLLTPTPIPLPLNTPTPTPVGYRPLEIDLAIETPLLRIHFTRIDFLPDLIVFVGKLHAPSRYECISRDEFTLITNDQNYQALPRDATYPYYQTYGVGNGFFDVCASTFGDEDILLPFARPATLAPAYLRYGNFSYVLGDLLLSTNDDGTIVTGILTTDQPPTQIKQALSVTTSSVTPTQPSSPQNAAPKTTVANRYQVTVLQAANIRSGPGTDFPIVGSREAGATVIVIATNASGDWLALDDGNWIAGFLVEPPPALPTATPSSTPMATATPNSSATRAAEQRSLESAQAQATIEARVYTPPVGTWCAQNNTVGVCVGGFQYADRFGDTTAAAGTRFVSFAVYIQNIERMSMYVNPCIATLEMSDGRTFAYSSLMYDASDSPCGGVTIQPDAHTLGGILFHVPSTHAPARVIYESPHWFDSDIVIDLSDSPIE